MAVRTLRADEIETRVASTTKDNKRCNVLLYKTARTDYDLLDEVYGASNWQCDYREIKGVMYGGIGVFIDGKWVWKWNAGVESQGTGEDDPNNQKGEASDALKRAGFCWGIGRELYKWKDIWVELVDADFGSNGKVRQRFEVSEISYDENGEPKSLTLVDRKGDVRFKYGKRVSPPKSPDTSVKPSTPDSTTTKPENTLQNASNAPQAPKQPSPAELAELRSKIKQQNAAVKKLLVKIAFDILGAQYPQDEAIREATEATRSYLIDVLRINPEITEYVDCVGRPVSLDDTMPLIQGDVPLIVDDAFIKGEGKQGGFETYVRERLPFRDEE